MSSAENVISIKVLDRVYKIRCPTDQVQALQEAANYLDENMEKIRQAGPTASVDRLAVVAALNIAHELMLSKKQKNESVDTLNERIQNLHLRIQNFINTDAEINV
jgi:cell division protein ZapA